MLLWLQKMLESSGQPHEGSLGVDDVTTLLKRLIGCGKSGAKDYSKFTSSAPKSHIIGRYMRIAPSILDHLSFCLGRLHADEYGHRSVSSIFPL